MDLFTENSPETCSSLGLDCGTCIHQAAATLAKISRLEPIGVHQIFFQLYPSTGCRPMASTFEAVYREIATPLKPVRAVAAAAAA